MNVLGVVAHPDDEVLGVGGTLARHAADGDDVSVCILADGVGARHDEIDEQYQKEIKRRRERAHKACGRLGIDSVTCYSFPDNKFDSVSLLEIVKVVEEAIEEYDPAVVYTHHYGDLNVDHELTARAVTTATRPLRDTGVERVLAFETLSATEWSVPSPKNAFQPQQFVNIADHLEQKIDALQVYEDELREQPHPRTVETVRQNARVWGAKSGVPAAEPFELIRAVRR